jgi:hypothetical protein
VNRERASAADSLRLYTCPRCARGSRGRRPAEGSGSLGSAGRRIILPTVASCRRLKALSDRRQLLLPANLIVVDQPSVRRCVVGATDGLPESEETRTIDADFSGVVGRRLLHVGVHEAFGVKLAEHEQLPRRVVANHAHVMVHLAILVLLLRRVRRRVRFLKKSIVQDELVGTFCRAPAGLAGLLARFQREIAASRTGPALARLAPRPPAPLPDRPSGAVCRYRYRGSSHLPPGYTLQKHPSTLYARAIFAPR